VLVIFTGAKSKYMLNGGSDDVAARLGIRPEKLGSNASSEGRKGNEGIDFVR
jgi:hypothetical protein